MAYGKQQYVRLDDEPHLSNDDLAGKVLRYIRYVSLVDTRDLTVIALGRTIVLSGTVSCEAELGCIEDAAASVIGVHLIENTVTVRRPH
ncbi:BON domain-containing protein [Rhizobium sp. CC-YZS058]|uniref:BON domain-containing protein n=1 Tax=Rhizobium sp. CC-YZS058 TaxID=3042153 RepID=UPI002B05E69A|nr:BON domain-containing protein [Rhizobium sp. CC-YZS058]MEA3533446.1 BON domain-containing protein [Rhizobium sp. CC-YZS058]